MALTEAEGGEVEPELTDDEHEAMQMIVAVMNKIQTLNGRPLVVNQHELAHAIHTLQFFVLQEALARLGLFGVNNIWRAGEN